MRGRLGIAALAACAIACGGGDATHEMVVARVGSSLRSAIATPALSGAPRKLGVDTRHALAGDRPFEVEVPATATRLAWSQGATAPHGSPGRAHFRIELREGGAAWRPLFEGDAQVGNGWRDRAVRLPASDATRRLRFSAEAAAPVKAWWGSPLLLGPADAPAHPSVILISLDTLGAAYLGAFSGDAEVSPHIDAFLAGAASFRHAYAQYGNTLVSHASLFSALQPRHHGVYSDGGLPVPLPSSLVETLAASGYHTAAFTEGGFVSAAFGFGRGFDRYDDGVLGLERQIEGGAATTFDHAFTWLETVGAYERFFLFVHTYEVHSPYLPRSEESLQLAARLTPGDDRVPPREVQARELLLHNAGVKLMSPRDLARFEALHEGEVHDLDGVIGRFLSRLDAAGLSDDTLVVITADHGDQFGQGGKVGHGDSLHDRVLHVPLAFRLPGVTAPRRIDVPVALVDVMPTILDLVGVPVPPGLDGTSLAGAVTGRAPAPARPAYSEQRSARGECARLGLQLGCRLDRLAVHLGHWKLVTSKLPPWRRLYDLSSDPLEQRDVAAEHPDELARLSGLAAAYRQDATPPHSGKTVQGIDEDTRRRLHDLGYAAPGDPPGDSGVPTPPL